jgi:hypothetical protein
MSRKKPAPDLIRGGCRLSEKGHAQMKEGHNQCAG